MDDWFEEPAWESAFCDQEAILATLALDAVFGFEILAGGCFKDRRPSCSPARGRSTLALLAPELTPSVTLCAPLDTLPFRSDSIDAISCAPHPRAWSRTPMIGLRESRACAHR